MAFGDNHGVGRGSGIVIKLTKLDVANRLGVTVRSLAPKLVGISDKFDILSKVYQLINPYKVEELISIHDAAIALQMDRRKIERMIARRKVRSFSIKGEIYVCLKDFITNTK